jgi:hypothetical protein
MPNHPSDPLTDTSRWTLIGSRLETPQFLIDEMRAMFRDCYGDEIADAMEAIIPPPYGTLTGHDIFATTCPNCHDTIVTWPQYPLYCANCGWTEP